MLKTRHFVGKDKSYIFIGCVCVIISVCHENMSCFSDIRTIYNGNPIYIFFKVGGEFWGKKLGWATVWKNHDENIREHKTEFIYKGVFKIKCPRNFIHIYFSSPTNLIFRFWGNIWAYVDIYQEIFKIFRYFWNISRRFLAFLRFLRFSKIKFVANIAYISEMWVCMAIYWIRTIVSHT